jgi:putative SOS response-associated peptidase YedK
MCNFYARYREPRNLQTVFKFPEQPNDPPRYVVRPTDTERVVAVGKDRERHSVPMRWGLAGAASCRRKATAVRGRPAAPGFRLKPVRLPINFHFLTKVRHLTIFTTTNEGSESCV